MQRFAKLFFVCSLLSSCGQNPDSSLGDESSELDAVVLDTQRSRWPKPNAIPVCLINRKEASAELVDDLKNYVTKEYADKTGLRFVGWGDCQTSDLSQKMIRVTFRFKHNWSGTGGISAGGGLSMVGMSSSNCGGDCRGGTMRLDVGSTGAFPSKTSRYRDFAVSRTRATAIHEFGHAIGLMHEHERADAQGCNKGDGTVVADDSRYTYVTGYDAQSIMNYCHGGDITTLTKSDIAGVAYLYPSVAVGH